MVLSAVRPELEADCDLQYHMDPYIPPVRMAFPMSKQEVTLRHRLNVAINSAKSHTDFIKSTLSSPPHPVRRGRWAGAVGSTTG